jgi:ABC-type Fe3+/spermidine/putrescine transport system ATPase subunit
MIYSDIELFNKDINIKSLKEYRVKVGISTKKIIESLEYNDVKTKVKPEQLEKIKQNGGVVNDPKSIWLLDFWGKKNILGLIMMPITRHQIVHLNDCFKIKEKYN